MLKVLSALGRVAFGFVLACVAAGLVTVLFVNTPAEVMAQPASRLPETASETLDLALLTATHAALFAATFVLITAGLGEWLSIRALSFYLAAGVTIALLGFAAQYSSEVAGQPTIFNNYAMTAFLTTGFCAGFVYWLASGQFAGSAPEALAVVSSPDARQSDGAVEEAGLETARLPDKDADGVAVRTNFSETAKRHYGSLLGRLKRIRPTDADAETQGDLSAVADDDVESVVVRRPAKSVERRNSPPDEEPDV